MDIPGLSLANAGSWSVMGTSRSKIHQSGKVRPGSTTPLGTGKFSLKANEHNGKPATNQSSDREHADLAQQRRSN